MAKSSKRIILTTGKVNSRGYRLLPDGRVDGIFQNGNAPLLYNHHRSSYVSPELMPYGRWEDLQLNADTGEYSAIPVFDDEDKTAKKLENKYENDFLNAASILVFIHAISDEEEYMLPGQTRPTVIRWSIGEASLVDIPCDQGALKLSYETSAVNLTEPESEDKLNAILPLVKTTEGKRLQFINKNHNNMKTVLEALGLEDKATEAQALVAVSAISAELKAANDKNDLLVIENKKLKDDAQNDKAEALVDAAIASGKITEAQKSAWLGMAKSDYDNANTALEGMKAYKRPTDVLKDSGAGSGKINPGDTEKLAAKFDEMEKAGTLSALKTSDPDKYKELVQAKLDSQK